MTGAAVPGRVRPAPITPARILSPRLPAFWLAAGLIAVGAWRIGDLIQVYATSYPRASVAAFVLFSLYAIPFLQVVHQLDYLEREPPVLLAIAFGWGGLVATSLALSGNSAIHDIIAKTVSPAFGDVWTPAIAGPSTEETAKALGVLVIVLLARHQLNSVLDGVVYGALIGLGFQVVEDFVYAVNAVALAGDGDQLTPVAVVFLARGFLGGLWSHTMFTALAGAGIGYAVVSVHRSRWIRLGVAVLAFAGAWTCHFVWNSPLLAEAFSYGLPGVLAAVLIKGSPGFLLVLYLVRAARRHEADYYARHLSGLDPAVVTPREITALVSGRRREAARVYARHRAGLRGMRLVRRLQRAQARLAVELSRAASTGSVDRHALVTSAAATGRTAAMDRCLRDIAYTRDRLTALAHAEAVAPASGRRTAGGWGSVVFGVVGLLTPGGSVVALILAAVALRHARQRGRTPDPLLAVGVTLGVVGIMVWLVVLWISILNGG